LYNIGEIFHKPPKGFGKPGSGKPNFFVSPNF